jgi:hypothetical protein
MEPETIDTRTAVEQEPVARWEDYVDIFVSPAAVFRRRADDAVRPPLLALLGLGALLYLLLIPANRLIFAAAAPADPQAAAFLEDYGTIMQVAGVVAVPITTFIMVVFAAAVLWGVAMLFGVTLPFRRALLVSTYAGFVLLIGQVAAALLALLHSGGALDISRDLSLGIARFWPGGPIPDTVGAVLRRFEVFAIWQAVLWGVGVRWVARTTAGRAAAIAFIAWALLAVPTLLLALLRPTPGI